MFPQVDAIGVVVSDMTSAVAFYGLLGLSFPEGAEVEGHVEAELPGGGAAARDPIFRVQPRAPLRRR